VGTVREGRKAQRSEITMIRDQRINVFVTITLVELMVAIAHLDGGCWHWNLSCRIIDPTISSDPRKRIVL
jgi:hypothetical protein